MVEKFAGEKKINRRTMTKMNYQKPEMKQIQVRITTVILDVSTPPGGGDDL